MISKKFPRFQTALFLRAETEGVMLLPLAILKEGWIKMSK